MFFSHVDSAFAHFTVSFHLDFALFLPDDARIPLRNSRTACLEPPQHALHTLGTSVPGPRGKPKRREHDEIEQGSGFRAGRGDVAVMEGDAAKAGYKAAEM